MHYGAYSTDSLMAITNRPDLVFERGEGSWLTDHQGKRYLDFIQGWAVNCLGHCPPEIAAALTAQAGSTRHVHGQQGRVQMKKALISQGF